MSWEILSGPREAGRPGGGEWAREWTIRQGEAEQQVTVWMPALLASALRSEHPEASRFEEARKTEGRSEIDVILLLDDPPDRIEFYSEHLLPGVFRQGVRLNPPRGFGHSF